MLRRRVRRVSLDRLLVSNRIAAGICPAPGEGLAYVRPMQSNGSRFPRVNARFVAFTLVATLGTLGVGCSTTAPDNV